MNHLLNYHYHLRFTLTAKIKLIWDDDQCWLRRVPVCNGDKPEEKRFYFCCGEEKKSCGKDVMPGALLLAERKCEMNPIPHSGKGRQKEAVIFPIFFSY